jgi:integrase
MRNDLGVAAMPIDLDEQRRLARSEDYIKLTPELTEAFLNDLQSRGRTPETLQTYRRNLAVLSDYLTGEKRISRGTLETWREKMLGEGYAVRTVNTRIAVANSFLEFCGRREFQVQKPLELVEEVQPELTRAEYLRLLSTARTLGKEQIYLLVKVFGSMGLTLQDLPQLTVEAVNAGTVNLPSGIVHIPTILRRELKDYAAKLGLQTGSVFVTRGGKPINRSNVTYAIQSLCADAQVTREKGTPRCLRKMYQVTQAGIQANMEVLLAQAYDRLLEQEESRIAWADGSGAL